MFRYSNEYLSGNFCEYCELFVVACDWIEKVIAFPTWDTLAEDSESENCSK